MSNSLDYRKNRMRTVQEMWGGQLQNSLFLAYEIPKDLFGDLLRSVAIYVAKAMHFEYTGDEEVYMARLDNARDCRRNITPNGGVVPKSEYILEYNAVIKAWCEIAREFSSKSPQLLKRFRLTPNVRIKFAKELEENQGRGLDTALPHSDAWVEGPWGMNCHMPLFGDLNRNRLHFYKLIDEAKFSDEMLVHSPDYVSMQWVMDYFTDDELIPARGFLNLSDYALLHKTQRDQGSGTRISIDTTIFIGDHDVLPDRRAEYMDHIPKIGEDLILKCNVSESDNFWEKKSAFSHYTSGSIERIEL